MAVFRCKSCGGDLTFEQGATVCECEYCGLRQTIPAADSERLSKLIDKANRLRLKCEFDKAEQVYDTIVDEFPQEAEGYWGRLLCAYGIEYVDDPATGRKIPTCHRSSFTCFLDEEDFEETMQNADAAARSLYRAQGKQIEELRRGIIEVSGKEQPYDIFICYKETDEDGQRTVDSLIAQDVYDALTRKGYRVFFSRISLEDKLGTEYEPYIFAALNSAKVMLVFGTSYDNYTAVWVRNEWGRFIKLMASDKSKHLIPCYKDIDGYDIPKEMRHLQAQDMGKVGAIQDLLRGIEKLVGNKTETKTEEHQQVVQMVSSGINLENLLDRGNMALEDGYFSDADKYFDQVLNVDARCAEAYIGKLLAKEKKANLSAWVTTQIEKYKLATKEQLQACPVNTAHIEEKVQKYALAGYLEEETIRKEYIFDLGYYSALSCRKSQREKQLSELSSERLLTRAKQFAKGDTKKKLDDALSDINRVLDDRIAQAQKEDQERVLRVKTAYRAHIATADKQTEAGRLRAEMKAEEDAIIERTIANKREKINTEIQNVNGRLNAVKTEIISKNNQLSGLCFLKWKEKNALREQIAELESKFEILNRNLRTMSAKRSLLDAKTGDTILFGSYEQDNIVSNGKEDIEWFVLTREGNRILVTSKYALDCQPYNTSGTAVTWETCSLRTWLNTTFMNNAFSAEESAMIATTTVTADKNPKYSTNPGNDTQDKVFLLSITEAEKYFSSDNDRMCVPTAYAKAQGAYTSSSGNCWWWLRSPGHDSYCAANVFDDGSVHYSGYFVGLSTGCVRPALWINLDS